MISEQLVESYRIDWSNVFGLGGRMRRNMQEEQRIA